MCQNVYFVVCMAEKGHYRLPEESRLKPKFIDVRFEQNNAMVRPIVKTLVTSYTKLTYFKYLGSDVEDNAGIEMEIKHRVRMLS